MGALSPSTESFPFPLQIFFPLLRLHRPGAENVGPDADEGGAFLDGLHAVAGHAHRKLGQLDAEAGFEIVAQLAEPGEIGPGGFAVVKERVWRLWDSFYRWFQFWRF